MPRAPGLKERALILSLVSEAVSSGARQHKLYLVLDIWSRRIVGWDIHEEESSTHASRLMREACERQGVKGDGLVLHSDNGAAMKGAMLLATLESLGVLPSFSRPRVSDDNPFSEVLARQEPGRRFPDRP